MERNSNGFTNKTSIIMLCHNNLSYTIQSIESIRRFTDSENYELIVIDNGSTDGTRDWVSKQDNIIAVFNEKNEGIAKGYNQGIDLSSGENIAFINNDIVVTENWLDNMLTCLYSSIEVGAVGPISNHADYGQSIAVNYQNLDQMISFARLNNVSDSNRWEQRINLFGFCFIIKRQVLNKLGVFDEIYSFGLEDIDYCFRMKLAGYQLMLCKDVFVHHYGGVTYKAVDQNNVAAENNIRFRGKWGFDGRYSSYIRTDLLSIMDAHDPNEPIRILEVGCACGATLLDIKNRYKNAELYGIELNESATRIASTFARVTAENVEHEINYEEGFFDYILFPDVLEHLYDPWTVLKKLKKYLKANGRILASIPNVMHYTVLRNTILGKWEYEDRGLMDRTHIRFFTLREIQKMFDEAGYVGTKIHTKNIFIPEEDEKWIQGLTQLSLLNHSDTTNMDLQYRVYQYLVKSYKNNEISELVELIKQLEPETLESNEQILNKISDIIRKNNVQPEKIVTFIEGSSKDQVSVINLLAVDFYNKDMIELIIPLLSHALTIDGQHKDTLVNLGFVLYEVGEYKLALKYLQQIVDAELDEEVTQLIFNIKEKWISSIKKYRISIKIAADSRRSMHAWGDYHMALGLQKYFERLGHQVMIQVYPEWYNGEDYECDIVIVLRGLHAYNPNNRHINIMWSISHPDLVSLEEMNQYDHIFVASDYWAEHIKPLVSVPVESMLQCTDPELFTQQEPLDTNIQLLFVGNSRYVYRKIIRDVLPTEYDLQVYGNGWEGFIDRKYIKGNYIPNHELSKYYRSCDILLNDHWDDMREKGFLSNRIFDALAAEAFIVTDKVRGLEEVFGNEIVTYSTPEELKTLLRYYMENKELREELSKKYSRIVRDQHTYLQRVEKFIDTFDQILSIM
ncbi:glycosyltransferase family protein [Paenibacillus brevis]|uniref:Glycosyltransferase n=1 Tax=Paenibacillus brevis TaxID=2841508 RepID=A0ABS6FLD4_9BACL|nr:glycosyltransferase [Paenibacillus brevis]MBU5670964.1 glycosyltransferase [Paenibacillus brevis]